MSSSKRDGAGEGQFAFDGLDRVLHEKARLGILSSLVANPQGLLFSELKSLCDLTDGNLSRHMQVLQEAGLVDVWKGTQGKRPQTLVRMTGEGRARFLEYLSVLERIVTNAIQASETSRTTSSAPHSRWGFNPT
ncbi:MAG: transcriptional regulator [Planctomycetaceae bacterium]|nr:transcriptional regulator [Planctomycetaceae bacterium]